ncbi:hypothetical protein WA1_20095 [Scytonema hofmannii PCC 7110]|uniref:Uncharacterized protein n=1 Tax=Scytonema hofmannii PCC 7110 TaxID=128403 RepID=A0A139XC57_9CYAN|nr:hypothetical protein [Scytonema hofmannii]KYC42281.1 hypothetical protein WA1_20095 [Scytonema hofmannii PCC 7110]
MTSMPIDNDDPSGQEGALDQQAPTQNQHSIPTFSNWLEVISFLLRSKHGLLLTGLLIIVVGTVMSLTLYFMRPEQIEVTTKAGTFTLKRGNKQDAIILLSPVGGDENTPWVSTGIQVKSKDKVKITASGRVHTSLNKLIEAVQTDAPNSGWVGPIGSMRQHERPKDRSKDKLLSDKNDAYYGYGMLLAAVRDSKNGQVKPEDIVPVKDGHNFEVKTDGELVLTVNDIWLSPESQDTYAPPLKSGIGVDDENFRYYLEKAQNQAILNGEDSNSWSEKKRLEKVKEQYTRRLKNWSKISRNKNWNAWYEDNIGAFTVSVTVSK